MSTKAQQIRVEDETPDTELPEGWAAANLGAVVASMKNGLYKPANKYSDNGTACLRMYNIEGGNIIWKNIKRMSLSPDEVEEYCLAPGDLLVNRVNSRELVGKAAVFPQNLETCVFESKNIRVRLIPELANSDYINYGLLLFGQNHFNYNSQQVVGMASISQPQIADLPLLLPPRAEQDRIANKAKILFEKVEATSVRLSKLRVLLVHFRQAVLAAACSGKLTEDWRTQHIQVESATALLARMLAEPQKPEGENLNAKTMEPNEIPDTWTWAEGGQLFSWGSGKFLPKKDQHSSGPYEIYGGNGVIGKHNKAIVPQPTLVVGRVGAHCGNVYVTTGPTWITDNAIYAAHIGAGVQLNYISFVFKQANLNANAGGSGQPFVNQETLNSVLVPLPPTEEQKEICRRVDSLFKLSDAIEKRVAAATLRAEKLTQAILAKAFRGELVPTEAELARREGREYEPASVLLERIRKEREKVEEKPKRGKRVKAVAEA